MSRKLTQQDFEDRIASIFPEYKVLGKYTGADKPVEMECGLGHKFNGTPKHLSRGHGCPRCGTIKQVSKRTKTREQLIQEVSQKHPNIEILGQYINARTPIQVKCKLDNHIWDSTGDMLCSGYGCPKCYAAQTSQRLAKNHDWYEQQIKKVHGDTIKIDEQYIGTQINIKHTCQKCHHTWSPMPSNILRGSGCPKCDKKISKPEIQIVELLTGLGIENSPQHRIGKYIPDIVIPSLNLIIEYNGLIWHSTKYKTNPRHHLDRLLYFHDKGYRTIQIWEDEWLNEQERIVKWLKYILGVDTKQPSNFGKNKQNEFDLAWWTVPSSNTILEPKQRTETKGYPVFDCGSYV